MYRYNATLTAVSKTLSNGNQEDLEKWVKKNSPDFINLLDYRNLHRKQKDVIHIQGETLTLQAIEVPDEDVKVVMPETLDSVADKASK